jgi:hypothetical protein
VEWLKVKALSSNPSIYKYCLSRNVEILNWGGQRVKDH